MKRGRKRTGEPGTEQYAKPGPKPTVETRDLHLFLPVGLVEAIDRLTDNRRAWIVQALQSEVERETNFREFQNSSEIGV